MINKRKLIKLEKILILIGILIFLNLNVFIAEEINYYEVSINYSDSKFKINEIKVLSSEDNIDFIQEPIEDFLLYSVKIFDENNNLLNRTYFYFSDEVFYDYVDNETGEITGGGSYELNNFSFEENVPYESTAGLIILYDPDGNELTRKTIERIGTNSDIPGGGGGGGSSSSIKKTNESQENEKNEIKTENNIDTIKENEQEKPNLINEDKDEINKTIIIIAIAIILLLISIGMVFRRKNKKRNK